MVFLLMGINPNCGKQETGSTIRTPNTDESYFIAASLRSASRLAPTAPQVVTK